MNAAGNTIRNFIGNSNGSAAIIMSGLLASKSTGASLISRNTIHSLTNSNGAGTGVIYGMSLTLPIAANLVERNLLTFIFTNLNSDRHADLGNQHRSDGNNDLSKQYD